ncbi:hypothetical protein CYMTET_3629 [Cymbomonas tetramitiformis]|uniref:Uncharacterized protein n=1 Tax=Cymbomonas tetramitiformis TaxID=36881 RepID=A0AAE0H332_9CHLO|nr:hypothetical protein CYMTET_3629 [Cymbomonas tetramitiformis]
MTRFAAKDLPVGGNWSQTEQNKRAANKRKFGSHNFNVSDFENDMYAEQFQCAMEEDDSDKFNALCFLVGGEPEMCDELSAYSFGVTAGGAPSALGKYAAY